MPSFADDTLEAFLKPIKPKQNDEGVDRDWVCHHWDKVANELLKGVQAVEVDSVQPGLGACTTRKEEGVNVRDISSAATVNENRAKESK